MPGCMAAMAEALDALARGDFVLPLRPSSGPRAGPPAGADAAYRGGERPLYGLKTVAVFPDNPRAGSTPTRGR